MAVVTENMHAHFTETLRMSTSKDQGIPDEEAVRQTTLRRMVKYYYLHHHYCCCCCCYYCCCYNNKNYYCSYSLYCYCCSSSNNNNHMSQTALDLDKPSIMKRYYRRWTCSHTSVRPSCSSPLPQLDRLVGLVVKASASRAEGPGFESRLRRDFFGVESYQWLKKLARQWLPCQAPGVIGSALGLVGPVSVYCDWVR